MPFGAQGEFQAGGGSGSGGGSSGPTGPAGGVLAGTYPNPSLSTTAAGTTQATGDTSTKLATDAFVATAITNALATINPAVAVLLATVAPIETSGLTYANGVGGIGATFTGIVNTPITIDSVALTALGQRVLIKNDAQSPSGAFNGVYTLTVLQTAIVAPVLTRALDYNQPSDINNTGAIPVQSGTANAGTSWLLTSQVVTMGTDPLTYTQFTSAVLAKPNAVVGYPLDTIVEIDGLSGSPDRLPASPNAANDEFNENTSGVPSGWTAFTIAPTTVDTNTDLSHLHMVTGSGTTSNIGIYKAVPSIPFDFRAKLSDAILINSQMYYGIGLWSAVPNAGSQYTLYMTNASGTLTVNASFGVSAYTVNLGTPFYFRIRVNSTTSMDVFISRNGYVWTQLAAAVNPGFTIANVAVWSQSNASGQTVPPASMWDWVRF